MQIVLDTVFRIYFIGSSKTENSLEQDMT